MLNEFRQNLVSGEWVLFATNRVNRPQPEGKIKITPAPKNECPFEDPEARGNVVLETYPDRNNPDDWFVKVAKNKFPLVAEPADKPKQWQTGPFQVLDGRGAHELVIYRDHEKTLGQFSGSELAEVFRIYQRRFQAISRDNFAKYILIFHNHGVKAGASLTHPHTQILSMPILPPDVRRSILGSEKFYQENQQKVYDIMLDWERRENKRVVCENQDFIAFCPFVSKVPYEIRIFPKKGLAHFEQVPAELLPGLGELAGEVFSRIDRALDNPDYNFFVHTAPLGSEQAHDFYTWHIEILPQLTILGGFDLGSGIDINIVDPNEAAKLLREAVVDEN